jgi:hypothetical protein
VSSLREGGKERAAVLRNHGKAAPASEAKGPEKRRGKKRAEGKRGGRPRVYGPEFTRTLSLIREGYGQMRGKLPVPLIRSAIDFMAESKKPDYGITGEIRALALQPRFLRGGCGQNGRGPVL